ncbi:MAG: tRNA 2-thiouridine(34) synthase MnmA [Clostridia bacterium]|nr:tRNA 2-thiouridine(34) synthase MnmA [Clostridia bacterium]
MQKKVLLLMSGGVDSSVSALLLKKKNYSVTGVTMKLQKTESSLKEIQDAQNIAKKLGIEHVVVDLTEDFSNKVIDPFVNGYLNGITPNPCVECNKWIKFGEMFKIAEDTGFDYIATGHYARVVYNKEINKYVLKKSKCKKDQSYVLYNLDQTKLKKILFPVADFEKDEIREIARENNLYVFDKPDSQDICFIKNKGHVEFIENYINKKVPKGEYQDKNGNYLGTHEGIIKYTIGQRKGLGISFGQPTFVIEINAEKNAVILGDEASQFKDELIADNLNFTLFDYPEKEMEVMAKIRFNSKAAKAKLIPLSKDKVKIKFYEKQKSITPGQSVVFYHDDTVLGGGVILKS